MKKFIIRFLSCALVLSILAIGYFQFCTGNSNAELYAPVPTQETTTTALNIITDVGAAETTETTTPTVSLSSSDYLAHYKGINDYTVAVMSLQGLSNEPIVTVPSVRYQNDYLRKDIAGNYSNAGTLFTAYDAVIGETNVSCIFGHTMKNGKMFGQLTKFLDRNYMEKNSTFSITTDAGTMTAKVIAAGKVDSDYDRGGWYYPQSNLNFEEFEMFRQNMKSHARTSTVDLLEIPFEARYIILSCCSYGYEGERTFVLAQIV